MPVASSDLPTLRQDLEILRGPPGRSGEVSYIIADHVRHRYFKLGQEAVRLLSSWRSPGSESENQEPPAQAAALADFLTGNQLVARAGPETWKSLLARAKMARHGLAQSAMHGYLFFRLPLVAPQPYLDAAWPFLAFLFTRGFATFTGMMAVFALALLSRQWDAFVGSFGNFITPEGAFAYGLSLLAVKAIHELGHAFMARKYGVRVSVMGVAFMVLVPVLYSDTSASWRLESGKRLMITAAGIFAELTIATFATVAWLFLPEGTMRSAAFTTATIGWVMSLAVNLNPLMRFDGYYLFADFIGIENLQERAFSLARWRMRETLFGFGEPVPEMHGRRTSAILLTYAFSTWVYRFLLFVGIAVLVYHFFIKPVAILLFAIEIVWFIALPVWRELREWAKRRRALRLNRNSLRTMSLFAAGLMVLLFPWQDKVTAPAVLRSETVKAIYPAAAGRIVEMNAVEGMHVAAGTVIARVESPDLAFQQIEAKADRQRIEIRSRRLAADDETRSERIVLENELSTIADRIAALGRLEQEQALVAPVSGVVRNVAANLGPNVWIGPNQRIAVIVSDNKPMLEAYLSEGNRQRVETGARATFYPEEPEISPIAARLVWVAPADTLTIANRELADIHGGPIPTIPDSQDGVMPQGTWYPVRFLTENGEPPDQSVRGTLHIEAESRSIAGRILRRIAGVLIRESGF